MRPGQLPPGPTVYIRIDDLARAGLTADQVLEAVARSIRELGAAQALVLVHGRAAGMRKYYEHGGCVQFTSWGDPYIPVDQRYKRPRPRRKR